MRTTHRTSRPALVGGTVLLAALLSAACGSSHRHQQAAPGATSAAAPAPTTSAGGSTSPGSLAAAVPATTASAGDPTASAPTRTHAHPTPPARPTATTTGVPGPVRCTTAMLAASLGRDEGAAGHLTQQVILTNTSRRPCTLRGYGGYGLIVPGSSAPIEKVTRGGFLGVDPGPSTVTLAPGGHAYALIAWTTGASGEPCVEPTTLLVTPPNQTTSLRVRFAATVCDRGALDCTAWSATPLG